MEGTLSFSVASVVEDVLQKHGIRSGDLDLENRKAEEAALRRYEAAGWLRKMVGIVAAKDLPAEPSEEEFRLGLRSGIILCNVLNKVRPGAVSKVVEGPCDSASIPDGAPLSAFQYFENVRNFQVAVQEIGIPTFEASDLEQGGKSARIVNCVLALKSFNEWKQNGGHGVWKFGGNIKPIMTTKSFVRKNSEPFMNSFIRNSSMNDKCSDLESNKLPSSHSWSMLVGEFMLDTRPEEVPMVVESLLSKVAEEFERRIAGQCELRKATSKDADTYQANEPSLKSVFVDRNVGRKLAEVNKIEDSFTHNSHTPDEKSKGQLVKYQMVFDQQQRDVHEMKHSLHAVKAGVQSMQMKFYEEIHNLGVYVHDLAHAASGYHKVLEENRKLYNHVQDLKGSIRVYCRIRPFLSKQSNCLSTVDHIEDGSITINTSLKYGKGLRSFTFNKVFGPSATQAEVFSDMQPLIRSVLDGYNVCIFAYGQTGSGKTHTMTGPKELTEKSQGVNYRALGDLFLIADQRKDAFRYDVSVQMIEIYNEQVRDLLVTDGTNKRLEIRNSSQSGLNVPDANVIPVSSKSDVIDLMNLGQRNRVVGATALNDRSSRSHSCLTVHVQGRDLASGAILRGCMHLVDLAGSERVNKSEVTGDRLKEAQHINRSLSALGDVIASLAQKNPHVPYRNSKLTQLLQDSLGGQAKTLMFVHISPEPEAVGETISTLKFAERVATVELGAARVNKDSVDVKELKEQIVILKAELARKETEDIQNSVSATSGKRRTRPSELLPICSANQDVDMLKELNALRQPMGDVGNIELSKSPMLMQKKQSFDVDELLVNSPPWPPVNYSPGQNYGEDDKDTGSGEWVDKVMVNKQDLKGVEKPSRCWGEETEQSNDVLYQKYIQDSSNPFNGTHQFNHSSDGMDDLDVATSDSSEADLLWQFNNSKMVGLANGIGSKTKGSNPTPTKSPQLCRNSNYLPGPSPSRKAANGVGPPLHRSRRQPASADAKRKTGLRK